MYSYLTYCHHRLILFVLQKKSLKNYLFYRIHSTARQFFNDLKIIQCTPTSVVFSNTNVSASSFLTHS